MARTIDELPGPRGLPLIGNAHQLVRTSRVHITAEEWSRRYGPIMRVDVGRRRIVGISDLDAINEILRERPEGFRRWRELEAIGRELGPTGVVVAEGEEWRRQRQLVVRALNSNYLHRYFDVIRIATERLHRRLSTAARNGVPVQATKVLTSYAVDITSTLAFGVELNTLERGENEMQTNIQRIMQMTSRRLSLPIPYWRWVKLPADRALERSVAEVYRAVEGFIEQARARMRERPELFDAPENFLEAMLAAQREDGTFTDEEIVGNVQTLLVAGEDTTAHTLAWTIWLICSRPDVQRRLCDEARSVLGDGVLPAEHTVIERLEYSEAVLRESMRVKAVGPLVAIEPLVDRTICDTHIPAGTRLLLLMREAALRREQSEREFDPERWLKGPVPDQKSFLAFGAGPRFCPGRNLAFLESKTALAMIARNFEVELEDANRPVRELLNFTMIPDGLSIRLTPRALTTAGMVSTGA
ncbi:MAG TPA: cytochrome P450 [Solirubrobacteraceae bacterium]|jgi:cytochrome P450|nr:cytochrome P450 [Solirubrobacteraceae bacterium]